MSDQAEPGSTKDVSEIVKAFSLGLGPDAPASSDPHFLASYHGINPDAICGERCRHATNPRFLSTRGIQIALTRFDEIKVDFTSGTLGDVHLPVVSNSALYGPPLEDTYLILIMKILRGSARLEGQMILTTL